MARGTTIFNQVAAGNVTTYKAQYQALSVILNQASVRTSDTGQVNWAAVSTESGTVRDYEIFALGGALQATAPVFLRFDYVGSNSASVTGLHLTVGTTTDGAGNLGGITVAKWVLLSTVHTATNQYAWAASDGESYFTFLYALDPTQSGVEGIGMFVVERTRDAAGQPTGAGFHVWRWQGTTTTGATNYLGGWSKTFGAGTQPANVDYNLGVNIPDPYNTNNAFVGTTSRAFPAYTYTPPFIKGASKALLFCYPGELPRGKPVTVDHYGEAMTFVPLGDAVTNNIPVMNNAGGAAVRALSPLIRWD